MSLCLFMGVFTSISPKLCVWSSRNFCACYLWPWVVRCWHDYLSGARCRLAYGPADATATHCLCFTKIQIGVTFLLPAHLQGSPGKRAAKRVCVCVIQQCTLVVSTTEKSKVCMVQTLTRWRPTWAIRTRRSWNTKVCLWSRAAPGG